MPLICGVISTVIGAIAFTLSWNLWEVFNGPLPGYQLFLFPGNLSLIHFWHPLFTEEVNFWPKLAILLFGQFSVVTFVTIVLLKLIASLRSCIAASSLNK
ncbi:MAG: hypothetical protein ACPGTQ_10435 [Colwellia sp.]